MKLLSWKAIPSKKTYFWHGRFSFQCLTDYTEETDEIPKEVHSFEAWCEHRKQQSPHFHFWYMVLSMQLVILLLIRSLREANFSLYCQSLAEIIPYFFVNNNINYARLLPVHFRDMVTLKQKHPKLAAEF